MSPGKELDVLISEKVMGWNQEVEVKGKVYIVEPHPPHDYLTREELLQRVPDYSTSIAEAWQVAEKVCDDRSELWKPGNEFMVKKISSQAAKRLGSYVATYEEGGVYVTGESAPHAICLAALKSVGVEV